MNYSNILKFKYTWRAYQARVLDNTSRYINDGKIHIVAAPGSGKTTLGIELIARMGEVALVLAPSITIREQWVQRIVESFLVEGINPEDYISQDLKNPRAITVATYQALHSAMNRYKGSLDESGKESSKDEDDKPVISAKDIEEVDYSDFNIIKCIRDNRIRLLCLDECHHLRSEWWKALEELKKKAGDFKVIALTATPPYDSTPAMWDRYMNMCGDIDEEIAIPELVKEGSLCPHQDFVYFNYPTQEEKAEVNAFKERSKALMDRLMADEEFASVVASHKGLIGMISDDELLDKPNYLASILIFLQAKGRPFPDRLRRLLGAKRMPDMTLDWLEELLQGLLYEDTDGYSFDEAYIKALICELKAEGLIEKKRVSLVTSPSVEKMLTTSKGKCESIKKIVSHEYGSLGKDLRLLVLTDYIRKEYEKAVGTEEDISALGVIPFFEQLRRSIGSRTDLRLGVLCGTIVVIPAEAKEALMEAVGNQGQLSFVPLGSLPEHDYVKVNTIGDSHFLTSAVTQIFTEGHMQVLIGTKSLLGEGWDAPCINSLILASFVGSFMLSNQMRGRAIRVFKPNPDKTSNIWHLVCVPDEKTLEKKSYSNISEDYALLQRRMEHFLGLHYTENLIESGVGRLSIIRPPFDEAGVAQMNAEMLELSGHREDLKDRWHNSLSCYTKMDIVEQTEVKEAAIPKTVYQNSVKNLILAVCLEALFLFGSFSFADPGIGSMCNTLLLINLFYAVPKVVKAIQLSNTPKRLRAIGNGVRKALIAMNLLEGGGSRVSVEADPEGGQTVFLSGGSGRDKALFATCIKEMFAVIDNQRYLLVRGKHKKFRDEDDFLAVPDCFAKRREDVELFYSQLKAYIGEYDLVYTRNEAGRQLLLEGRMKALANRKANTKSKKKVKNF